MKKIIHKARGVVRLTVTGAYPERFLNECAARNILFWGACPVDGVTLRVNLHARDLPRAKAIAGRLLCELREEGKEGLPFFLARLRRRYALLVGLALSMTAVLLFSQFILTVEVEGNETVPAAVILSELRRLGVRPGAFGPGLDEATLAQQALLRLEDLSWMAINVYGTKAQVLVRERTPKPPLEDDRIPADVVAGATGLILHLETWQGKALRGEGDTVVAGDVVISGWVPIEPPPYSELKDLGGTAVRARGRVEVRTWRILTATIPTQTWVKSYTGREQTFYSLNLLGKRVNFYRNSGISFAEYDKITQVKGLTLPGGYVLPATLTVETIRETEQLAAPANSQEAAALLERQLRERLEGIIGERGECITEEFSTLEQDGLLTVRLLAECREEIGETVDWPTPTS